MGLIERLDEAGAHVRSRIGGRPVPRVGAILGSGLGRLAEDLEDAVSIPYGEIPHFPVSTVQGHAGRLVLGKLARSGTPVAVLAGRHHLYEGYAACEVVFPARTLLRLGVSTFVITNAAGGLGKGLAPGDLMLISDHVNLSGQNALSGEHDERLGPRFPDMTEAYSKELRQLARDAARECGLSLGEGVYCALSGPSYETPAEIRMLATLGVDAVGMSTVHEVLACRQAGARVLGISVVSNLAAGIAKTPLTHEEVMETGARVSGDFLRLLAAVIPRISARSSS